MANLPSGTVCFLFSDIEGSTKLVSAAGARFPELLDMHFDLMRAAIEGRGGTIVSTEGDSVFAVLPTASAALGAAVDAQRALAGYEWPAGLAVSVRMGIHVGDAVFGGRDYTGIDVHGAARVMAAAWGGEILVTDRVRALLPGSAADGITLRELGEFTLRDIPGPVRLYQVVAAGLRAEFPPPRTQSAAAPTNLPVPLTRFVGRAREMAQIRALLAEARLVTLTGPGGTGKTRLAIEVGRAELDRFTDGVFFVALEAVREPDLVLPQVAQTLGLAEDPTRPVAETLASHLRERRMLLVLDNLEQVIDCAPLIAALLAAAPEVSALVSSREPLRVAGESVYAVPALSLPSEPSTPTAAQIADLESVQLFVERARQASPAFELTDENAPAIAAICRSVDGLPLAIELAAARVNVLTPAQIVERLDHRLTLLAGSRRDVTDRQRTLRGAIDWSHELLSGDEKAAFRRLAVFAGGATLDAALAVIDPDRALETDALDLLGTLVGRSLVRTTDNAGRTRFSMLETIREYALEQLIESGERDAICARHANFFASIADQARQVLVVRDRDAQLEALDLEMPNFRGALDWTIASNQVDLATRMIVGLKDFWRTRSHLTEGIRLAGRVLDEVSFGAEEIAQADVLGAGAELANWKADYALAQKWTTEQLAILERDDDKARLALAYSNVAWANVSTNAEVARDYFYRAVSGAREANALPVLLGAEQGLAIALVRTGDLDEARAAALRAIQVGEQIGDRYTNMFNLLTLGYVELTVGNEAMAARRFVDGLETAIAADADVGLVTALDSTAFLLFHRDDLLQAARLAQTAERIRVAIGGAPSLELIGFGRVVDRVRERDAIAFDAAAAESPQMTKDEAIAAARTALAAIGGEEAA